eukprot:CAMPEP_0172486458 /NCGR_PEP_ID=MMETSP1066-20121228/15037_1 /TAXON_ID=671091 /ORGANISM="Coscinodiscus wailesii, Strain CCMP2513" /LENGTH=454 /DNA_ID=CAMNT_0013252427 /DNA_START=82 /DNA_END=1446 /DNA_ORIENTATION=+
MSTDYLEVTTHLAVDDMTRHWAYFRSLPRTNKERKSSIHKDDVGGSTVRRNIRVYNGRDEEKLVLDDASFELVSLPTSLSTADFYEIQENSTKDSLTLQQKYHDEVSTFMKNKLGCDKVVCFHSQVRNEKRTMEGKGVQGYASGMPHTDSSAVSADQLALSKLENDDPQQYGRYMYLNLWRNISSHPIENNHLTVLDERSVVKPDDYITKDLHGDGYSLVQYSLNARHADQHRWYYFPKMKKDEGILFKQFDSDWTKSGRTCFHMSVADPKVGADEARERESIELRAVCFWKKNSDGIGVDSMPTKENTNADLIKYPPNLSANTFDDASVLDLIMALVLKIVPFVYLLFGHKNNRITQYSGKPDDYLDKFVTVVDYFPQWPSYGVVWVKNEMKRAGEAKKGIAAITKVIMDDQMGYNGTKAFRPDEKKEIADYLVGNERFMKTAMKHWGTFILE